jgi:hypothetical protein
VEAANAGKQINKGYAHVVNIYGRGDIFKYMTRSMPVKKLIMKEITDLLGLPPVETTVGSSIPSVFFSDVAGTMGLPIVSGMPAMAQRIIENSGLTWDTNEFSSLNAPSGGGGTVTAEGLMQMKNAVLVWLGRSSEVVSVIQVDWEPAADWREKRESLPREVKESIARPGASEFRTAVLSEYENTCAISGYSATQAIDVAHIVPYYGEESDNIENAIPLRADLHKLYDKGFLLIDFDNSTKKYKVKVHDFIVADYSHIQGSELRIPVEKSKSPSLRALEIHNESFKNMWQVI